MAALRLTKIRLRFFTWRTIRITTRRIIGQGDFRKGRRRRCQHQGLLTWQSVHATQSPNTVTGKRRAAPTRKPTLHIPTCAVCGLPHTRGHSIPFLRCHNIRDASARRHRHPAPTATSL